jgi:very-short-patch-repair endonuclease
MTKKNPYKKSSELSKQKFFDTLVKNKIWIERMSGKNEDKVLRVLEAIGYIIDKDFVRQYPVGNEFVVDIAFEKEQIAIEIDGSSHNNKNQATKDRKRDKFLYMNNWVVIRIKDKDFFGFKASFYKNLIDIVVKERRKQWEDGALYPIDFDTFNEDDYV